MKLGFRIPPVLGISYSLSHVSKEPSVLIRLACSRHGHAAAREVLQVVEGPDRTNAKGCLKMRDTMRDTLKE